MDGSVGTKADTESAPLSHGKAGSRSRRKSPERGLSAPRTQTALLPTPPGIVGVGITKLRDDYAIKVNLCEPLPTDVSAPECIGDVPVCLDVVGKIAKRG